MNNSVIKGLKTFWWMTMLMQVAIVILQEFISPTKEVLEMSHDELMIWRNVFYGFAVGVVIAAFLFPKYLIKANPNPNKIWNHFFTPMIVSMALSVAIGTYGFCLNLFLLKEEGWVLNAIGIILLIYRFPRESQVESIMGEELAAKLLAVDRN